MKALLLIISTTFLLQHPSKLPDCDKYVFDAIHYVSEIE